MGLFVVLFCVVAGLGFYLLPTIVARNRRVANSAGIVLLNIFLGWTLLGWVGALIWACTAETQMQARLREVAMVQMARGFAQPLPTPPPPAPIGRLEAPNQAEPR
jgi:cytochrome c biogenesis protein CcdA